MIPMGPDPNGTDPNGTILRVLIIISNFAEN